MGAHETFQLEIVTIDRDGKACLAGEPGPSTQAGLRVPDFGTGKHLKDAAGQSVAQPAAERHAARKSAYSQHQLIGMFRQLPGNLQDVFNGVLAVGIGGYNTGRVGKGEKKMIEPGF